jgi:cell division septal protein FtsQ
MLKFLVKLVVLIMAMAVGRFAYEKAIALPQFALDKIELRGNSDISSDSVKAVSGLEEGKSVYEQNLKYAAYKISKQPGVIECLVERGFFSTVYVEISMAEPALLINGDELYCLSREGIVLPFDRKIPVLPLVTGRRFSSARCFDRLKDPDIAYAIGLYDALMAASPELCSRLSEINFTSEDIMNLLFSPGGTKVVVDKRDFYDAAKRVAVLNENGLLKGDRTFDFRFGPVAVESSSHKRIL